MSVRAIPKNYRNVTGLFASNKSVGVYFESTLERDFITTLEFDYAISSFDVQPLSVHWLDTENKPRKYTPDVLVHYNQNMSPIIGINNVLYEVKYRSDIKKNWEDYKPKFKAAIKYAKQNNMRFKLITEYEIRTDYMENARFLLPFLNIPLDANQEVLLINQMKINRECSIDMLVKSIFNDKWAQAELIPSLWHLIASRHIKTDLNFPLTMSSKIWL